MPKTKDEKIVKVLQSHANDTVNLALDTLKLGKQALVFVNTKKSAEKSAEDIALKIRTGSLSDVEEVTRVSQAVLKAMSKPTKQCERLARCMLKGTAFHHAGITAKQREIIEDGFRAGVVKIIACTPTLAAGVDLPAFRTIIRDVKRFAYTGWGGMQYIPVLEYLQMAGRAGRPSFDTFGESICIAPSETEAENIRERYLEGVPEEIYSKLAAEPILRFYLLSLIATGFVHTKKQIMEFFEKTFWAYQFRDFGKLQTIIERMLTLLERYEFIKVKNKEDEFVSANEILLDDTVRFDATLLGKRVAQLYLDPLTAHHIIKSIRRSTDVTVTSFSLLQMVSNTIEMRPLLRVKTKEFDAINEKFLKFESELLQKEPSIYEPEHDDFISSVKTAFFLDDWIDEKDEEFLLEEYDVRPGETRVKLDRANWLLYSAEELAKLMHFTEILPKLMKVKFRLKYGVREELIPLLKFRGIGRVRARKMYNAGIKDVGGVKNADISTLAYLVGKSAAVSLKRQVGEDVAQIKVPDGRRKGQMGLGKYS